MGRRSVALCVVDSDVLVVVEMRWSPVVVGRSHLHWLWLCQMSFFPLLLLLRLSRVGVSPCVECHRRVLTWGPVVLLCVVALLCLSLVVFLVLWPS